MTPCSPGVILCFLAILSPATALGCESNNASRCAPRKADTVATLPNAEELAIKLKGLLGALNGLGADPFDTGDNSTREKFRLYTTEATSTVDFIRDALALRQKEIDNVAQVLLPETYQIARFSYDKANRLEQHALVATAKLESLISEAPNLNLDSVTTRQFVHMLRSWLTETVQQGDSSSQMPARDLSKSAGLTSQLHAMLQKSGLQVQKLHQELALSADMDEILAEDDVPVTTDGMGVAALLDVSADRFQIRSIQNALDELLELTTHFRDDSKTNSEAVRSDWSNDLHRLQAELEETQSQARIYQAEAMIMLAHAQEMRQYVRALTITQYNTLNWYKAVVANKNAVTSYFHGTNRLASASLPMFDELIWAATHGDTPFEGVRQTACVPDTCGVCGGPGNSCWSCANEANKATLDVCGSCVTSVDRAGTGCDHFCDGVANSGKLFDVCGVCDGDGSSCTGCDGVPFSGKVPDRCGTCGGDGKTCAEAKGCLHRGCPLGVSVACPEGLQVNPRGYAGCCFKAAVDCVKKHTRRT